MGKSSFGEMRFIVSEIAICAMAIFEIVSGVKVLQMDKERCASLQSPIISGFFCEDNVYVAKEVIDMSRSMKFLPTMKERYYLVAVNDAISPLLIRASQTWFQNNFDAEGTNEQGVPIYGLVKVCQTDVASAVDTINEQLTSVEVSKEFYVDILYRELALKKMVLGILDVLIFAVTLLFYMLPALRNSDRMQFVKILLYIPMLLIFYYMIAMEFMN